MFFKKELCTTRDMKKYNELTSLLSQNGIKYTTVTNSPTNPGRYHGVPLIDSSVMYEYRIFVSRKDLENAKQFLNN